MHFDSLLSLYCGPGGLDLGFERAGFSMRPAIDRNPNSVATYNHNREGYSVGSVGDLSTIRAEDLDKIAGGRLEPGGVIGGPPCQSFSQSNRNPQDDDPRHELPMKFSMLLSQLNRRRHIPFFMLENVPSLARPPHDALFRDLLVSLSTAGFAVGYAVLNAKFFGVPQNRERLIVVGFNSALFPGLVWAPPNPVSAPDPAVISVRSAIWGLPEPARYHKSLSAVDIPHHPNHWCMAPKSAKFFNEGALAPGRTQSRSFKTLTWEKPSITVAYGNREVHIHPECKRRLSVYEAMKLQGFPDDYELLGSLSSQINQVSEAVPPPLAEAVARSIVDQIRSAG